MSEDRDKIRDILSAYIDGEVTQEQARSVEQAVAEDPELALELHEVTAAKRLVMGLPRQRAPRGFVRRVMARAERKHLLGDQQAGGAFGAARWITLAVAAVVLLTAGIGIIAISMLGTGQGPSPMANVDDDGGSSVGPGHMDFNGGLLHGKGGDGRDEGIGEARGRSATTGSGTDGGRLIVAAEALDYAVAHATNTSIYTHDVSNTLAVLNETFDRNDVLPLELEAPARDSKAADKPAGKAAEKKRGVSRGGLNFYYNKKQDDQQVQIVVLATDTVIEQLNGDIDKLARVQMVSQAPASDYDRARSDSGFVARRAGRPGTQKDADPSRDEEETVIARVEGDHTGLGVTLGDPKAGKGDGIRAKSKMPTKGATDTTGGKTAPAPAVPTAPKITEPAVDLRISDGQNAPRPSEATAGGTAPAAKPDSKLIGKDGSPAGEAGTKNGSATAVTGTGWQKYERGDKDGKRTPGAGKGLAAGPTTRPAKPAQVVAGVQGTFAETNNSGELEILSAEIAKEQKRGESSKQLEQQYSKLNSAFRQQILNDDLRRNVQSQQERGINVQALVININRRSLGSRRSAATQSGMLLRDDKALSRPRATTTSAPVSESTTQRGAQPNASSK